MSTRNLIAAAHELPCWRSAIVARIGSANVKIERLNAEGQPPETHDDFDEALIVLQGNLELECGGTHVSIRTNDLFVVPMKTPHRVLPGSDGVVLIVNLLPSTISLI